MAMKQKALLVAVGDYQQYATTLESPAKDILLWKAILEAYGFAGTDIRLRIDADAKHDTVIEDIKWLIDGVVADDQIVMIFLGHGRLVEAHDGSSEDYEEALIVYPNGDRTLKSAEITDSDITKIIEPLAQGVDALIVLDTCFVVPSESQVPGAKVLSIPPAFSTFNLGRNDIREFGSLGRRSMAGATSTVTAPPTEQPVLMAACKRDQVALELPLPKGGTPTPHMLFTFQAADYINKALAQNRNVSCDMIVRDIYPLAEKVEQKPEIRGNKARAVEFFPGQPGSPTRAADLRSADGTRVPFELNIRFEGIGCFADARDETDLYRKRLLFPHDTRTDPNSKHLTFIEIPRDHVENWSGALPKTRSHLDDPTEFLRWELNGHVISVTNADGSGPLTVSNLFLNHVAHMTDVHPPFKTDEYHPQPRCFLANPGSLLDAYFDLNAGTLSTGPIAVDETVFVSDAGAETLHIHAARYTTLRLPLKEEIAIIKVVTFGGADAATIRVKRGGKVVIGNTREGDIIGDGTTEDPRDHFNLYYKLAKNPPPDKYRPKPAKTAVPVNFCSQTTWP